MKTMAKKVIVPCRESSLLVGHTRRIVSRKTMDVQALVVGTDFLRRTARQRLVTCWKQRSL